jgi:cell wall-associated NlpC family hydrolase
MQILKYIGIPYQVRGENFSGADCWGLCRLFARHELGLSFPRYMYDEGTNIEEAMEHIKNETIHNLGKRWIKVDKSEAVAGDLCIFRIQGQEVHCGIHLDKLSFLHSLKGRSSCVENLTHVNWTHRYVGSFRWLG